MPADNDLYACHVAEIASPQYAFIYNPTNRKKTKTYGLEGLYTSLRQGRSLPLPTLPFQRTNRYAVVSAKQATNRYAYTMPFAWNSPQKSNRYVVVGAIQATNRYT